MNTAAAELLTAFEMHSVDRVRAVLDDGSDVRSEIDGKTPVNLLIEMYSDRTAFQTAFVYCWDVVPFLMIQSLPRFCCTTLP